jgi:hypothetical protein
MAKIVAALNLVKPEAFQPPLLLVVIGDHSRAREMRVQALQSKGNSLVAQGRRASRVPAWESDLSCVVLLAPTRPEQHSDTVRRCAGGRLLVDGVPAAAVRTANLVAGWISSPGFSGLGMAGF